MGRLANKNTGVINYMDLKKGSTRAVYWAMFFLLILITIICMAPPLWVIISSMKDIKEFLMIPPTIIPKSFHPEKLVKAWKMLNFGQYYLNTLGLAAGNVIFSITINGLAGYVLSRLKPKGSNLVFTLILWTLMLPNSVAMVPVFKNIVSVPLLGINLSNSYLPMWLMAGASAFNVLVFKSFFDGIPMSLIESARLDGCSDLGIFMRIVLPLSIPVVMTMLILTVDSTWKNFFWPYLILKNQDKYTVMVKIFTLGGSGTNSSIDIQMIALTFAIIPPAILFLFFQRHIMEGFTLSGIKG
jgi:multiple sugar transport system permease protein